MVGTREPLLVLKRTLVLDQYLVEDLLNNIGTQQDKLNYLKINDSECLKYSTSHKKATQVLEH